MRMPFESDVSSVPGDSGVDMTGASSASPFEGGTRSPSGNAKRHADAGALDDYWPSEHRYADQPAPFRCSFVIRIWEASAEETGVSVVEYQPTVRLGKKPGLGQHGPGMFFDTRQVDATRRDRQIVLDAISDALPR